MDYDVIIVGAGPAGYFCAYELIEKRPNLKVLLIDKGQNINKRSCPILKGTLDMCPLNKKGHRNVILLVQLLAGLGSRSVFRRKV